MSETKLLVKFRTKIDWLNYEDWSYSSVWSFDTDEEGLYSAKSLGNGSLKKNGLIEVGKKYRVKFEIQNYASGRLRFQVGSYFSTYFGTNGEHEFVSGEVLSGQLFSLLSTYDVNGNDADFEVKNIVIEEVGYTVLDTFSDSEVLLNYQFKDIQEPESIEGNYTKQIKLPGSESNNRFFKYIFNINEDSIFNMAGRCDAVIQVGEQTLEEGFIKLEDIIGIDDFKNYTITFYGQNVSLFNKIGDDTFEDLDFSDLNHTLTPTIISDSWNNFPTSSNYVYPYIDYGRGGYDMDGVIGNGTSTNGYGLTCQDLYPAISVKYIIDKIFDKYDFSYTSDLFNTDHFKKQIVPFGQSEEDIKDWHKICSVKPYISGNYNDTWYNEAYTTVDGFTQSQTYECAGDNIISTQTYFGDFFKWNFTSNDIYGRFNVSHSNFNMLNIGKAIPGTYKCFDDTQYRIRIKYRLEYNGGSGTVKLYGVKIPPISSLGSQWYYPEDSVQTYLIGTHTSNSNWAWSNWAYLDCKDGDLIGIKTTGALMVGKYKIHVEELEIQRWGFGINRGVDFNKVKPSDIKIKDFLKGINNMYNLTYTIDPDDTSNYLIEPYLDYFTDYGTTRNWTHKLDRDSEIKVELPKDYLSLYYNFKYKEDNDTYWSANWNGTADQYGLGFGGKRIKVDNDFIKDEKDIETIFKPSVLITPSSSDYEFSWTRYEKSKYPDEQPTNYKFDTKIDLRILYYEKTNVYGSKDFRFEGDLYSYYPYAGHTMYPNAQDNTTTMSLVYDLDPTVNGVSQLVGNVRYRTSTGGYEITENNLYNLYWKEYIENLIDKDARMVTAKFKLDVNDLYDFKFADKIFVNGTYYRVHKIKDFNPSGTELTEVELLKLSEAVVSFVTGATTTYILPPVKPEKPNNSLNLGRGNRVNKNSIAIGDNNYVSEKSIIIGDNSSGGKFVVGDNNVGNSKSTIIGDNVIIDNSGITSRVFDSDITVTKDGTYISGVRIHDGIIDTANEIEIGGIIETDGVFNPWKFQDYHIVEEGENGGNILDIYIYEIEAGNIDENPV